MKINIFIISLLLFDAYAFMRGKIYHVSDNYKNFYILHTMTVENYAALESGKRAEANHVQFENEAKKNLNHDQLFLP